MILRERTPRVLWLLLGAALVIRILAIFVDSSLSVLAQPDVSPFHHRRALALAQGWLDGRFFVPLSELVPPEHSTGSMRVLVAYALAPYYVLFGPLLGPSPVVGRIGTAIYGTGLGLVAYALARELVREERPALIAAAVTVFWPSIVYRSIVIQREVLVALSVLTAVWVGVRWARSTTFRRYSATAEFGALVVAAALLWVLRPENLLVIAATLIVAFAVRYRKQSRALLATGVVALAGIVFVTTTNLGTFIGGKANLTPAALDEFAHARAHGGSAYLTWLHYESWLDIVAYAPLKVVYFLGSPMPWRVNSIADLLAGASGWALLVASGLAVYGVVNTLRGDKGRIGTTVDRRAMVVLLAFLVVGVGAYAVIEMNGGAAFRRRIQFVPVILIFTAVALSSKDQLGTASRSTADLLALSDSASTLTTDSE